MAKSLLLVDDDRRFLETLKLEFSDRGFQVVIASSLRDVQSLLTVSSLDYAAIDLRLTSESGLEIVDWISKRYPKCRVVLMTGYGSIPSAIEAMKRGASDYLTKPFDVDRLQEVLQYGSAKAPPDKVSGETLAEHERNYIDWVLQECAGNVSKAARRLGLHRQSLQRKLKKYT
jgi:two-component system response regulator RegA